VGWCARSRSTGVAVESNSMRLRGRRTIIQVGHYLDHPQFEGFEVRQTVRRGEDAVA
jgi:hypothetical protein